MKRRNNPKALAYAKKYGQTHFVNEGAAEDTNQQVSFCIYHVYASDLHIMLERAVFVGIGR